MAAAPNPGQQPTPQQMAAMQQQIAMEAQRRGMTPQQLQMEQRRQLEAEAQKAGMTFEQYINKLKQQAFEDHQKRQLQAQQQGAVQQPGQPQMAQGQQGQQVPINPGAPDPRALALAKWLRSQDLKTRTCILNGQRKDMFRVKRALRAIESPAYTTAASKNPLLPPLTPTHPKQEIFKLLPLSLLALRVSKSDPHEGHNHAPSKPQKRIKGLWTVKIEQQQDINDDLHYVWLYDGPQWKTKLYAAGALLLIMTVVMFPLWPVTLRIGVWYLSMAFLGLIGLFFAMAIFRLILFCVTVFTVPPGLWLYPNLFEDVGFFDSFRPVWGWQEVSRSCALSFLVLEDGAVRLIVTDEQEKKKKAKKSKKGDAGDSKADGEGAKFTASAANGGQVSKRQPHVHSAPRVEEVEDE